MATGLAKHDPDPDRGVEEVSRAQPKSQDFPVPYVVFSYGRGEETLTDPTGPVC